MVIQPWSLARCGAASGGPAANIRMHYHISYYYYYYYYYHYYYYYIILLYNVLLWGSKRDPTSYLVGTEEGAIHRCSVSYNEQAI